MKTKYVIVVSHSEDGSAKLLMQRLAEIGQPHILVDLGLYPDQTTATIDYSDRNIVCTFRQNSTELSPDNVKSIWWRRPKGKVREAPSSPTGRYISLEAEIMANSFFQFFRETLWVSEPEKTRVANYKPLQLELARNIGFRVPKTIISNDPSRVAGFIRGNKGMPMIMKPVGTNFVRVSNNPSDAEAQNLAIYTKLIDEAQILGNIEMVANCPVMFQEAAEQEFDVRVTVVGEKVFAVKVGHSEDTNAGPKNVDWRHQSLKRTFTPFELPREVEKQSVELVRLLGLRFGAIDLGYSKKKGFVFFEINPQGQWVPSEIVAGYPISLSLAKLLAR